MNVQIDEDDVQEGSKFAIGDLVELLKSSWLSALIGIAIGLVLAFLFLLASPKQYTAYMVIGPVQDNTSNALSQRLGQLSSLASLAGVNVGQEGNANFIIVRQLLTSQRLFEKVQAEHQILQRFFPNSWDAEHKQWIERSGILNDIKSAIKGVLGLPSHPTPTVDDFSRIVETDYGIDVIGRTNLYNVTMSASDPELARQYLEWSMNDADKIVRNDVLKRTTAQIAYIERRLQGITVQEHREALLELLTGQEQQAMLMASDLPFAVTVIQPPTVSDRPTSPNAIRMLLFGLFLGGLGGVFYRFIRVAYWN